MCFGFASLADRGANVTGNAKMPLLLAGFYFHFLEKKMNLKT